MTRTGTEDQEVRVADGDLHVLLVAIYRACGMDAEDAGAMADSHVQSDLRGVHSHGALRVAGYVERLQHGGVDPRGRPAVVGGMGACAVVDGGNSMGQIGCRFAMHEAITRAATSGIAAVAVRGSNHCGALAPYAMQALQQDMIGLFTTHSLPIMAPWGGADRLIGNNPLAVAIPADTEFPIVHDAAFSEAAYGKVVYYQQQGWDLPSGWAFDKDGLPATTTQQALDGLLAPIGGFKGAGLGLVMGILSAMLADASYGTELGSAQQGPPVAGQDSQFAIALHIGAFTDPARFRQRVDGVIHELRASRRAPGTQRLYAPGELEFRTAAAYGADGIPLTRATLADLQQTAQMLNVVTATFPWLY